MTEPTAETDDAQEPVFLLPPPADYDLLKAFCPDCHGRYYMLAPAGSRSEPVSQTLDCECGNEVPWVKQTGWHRRWPFFPSGDLPDRALFGISFSAALVLGVIVLFAVGLPLAAIGWVVGAAFGWFVGAYFDFPAERRR